MSDPLHYQSLSEVCRSLKSGALRSVDVTQAIIDRADRLEPQLSAFALRLSERALQRAQQLDEAQAAGEPLGALHGVPIAIKDLLFLEGTPTASGTMVMQGYDPGVTATVVRLLEEAGAVLVGKTQLTEGAFGAHHPDIVEPKNPWNANHWPGVSSSGSGVSVASGMAYGALGSDTGGSIRFPCASCGLVGVKPTYGRVSRWGAFALAESLDHIGPMTRTVEDAARMLSVIAGEDPKDATSLKADVPNYAASINDGIQGLRIGVDWSYVETGVEDVVARTVREALRVLGDLGATIVEVKLPDSASTLISQWGVTTGRECARAHIGMYPEKKHLYGPVLAGLLELGHSISPAIYDSIELVRKRFTADFNTLLNDVDVMISPCMVGLPATVEQMNGAVADDGERAEFITFTAPFDYSGHPTITLPAGLEGGLPSSFQLVGRHLDEGTLIRAGAAFEQTAPFLHRPPID